MSEEIRVLSELQGDIRGLLSKLDLLLGQTRRRIRVITAAIVVMALFLVAVGGVFAYTAHRFNCITDYVAQSGTRSATVTPIFFNKINADSAYLRATHDQPQAVQDRLYEAMAKADDAYNQTFITNPLPSAPRYNC